MDAIVPITMRWMHLLSITVLIGGVVYARFVAGEMDARFKPMAYVAIGAILVSGLYLFLSKPSYPPHYQIWFGIKVLLALDVFAAVVLYRNGKQRSLTRAAIWGAVIVAIAGYLRWISLT
ncbi:MAG TPA: hypothetical protein VMG40_12380 [Bryobacteraceae bacterium]|nr:hypothetical protein [Bryobacteraceae bacterium]